MGEPGSVQQVAEPPNGAAVVAAPAKLTLSLRVTGVRPDGYHLLDAEMVSIDLADELAFGEGSGLGVVDQLPIGPLVLPPEQDNLVTKALRAVGRQASVRLVKRIPPGAGLGGGSSDAAAVLRWAQRRDAALAAGLGADVPFCLAGGRARVRGIGEELEVLDFERCRYLLVLSPFRVDTPAVYRAWDDGRRGPLSAAGVNDLETAALAVEPRLGAWRDYLGETTGVEPRLAGSGSAWFVALDGGDRRWDADAPHRQIEVKRTKGVLVAVRTTPPL